MSTHHVSARRRAQILRDRSHRLRALADQLDRSSAQRLADHAGHDTWHSPRADLCRWVLGTNRAQLGRCIDELRWSAARLEREAAEIEEAVAAALAAAPPGVAG